MQRVRHVAFCMCRRETFSRQLASFMAVLWLRSRRNIVSYNFNGRRKQLQPFSVCKCMFTFRVQLLLCGIQNRSEKMKNKIHTDHGSICGCTTGCRVCTHFFIDLLLFDRITSYKIIIFFVLISSGTIITILNLLI